jgi:hypothetical protein
MELNLGFDNSEPLNIDFNDGPVISQQESSSSNLGMGFELLMNDKNKPSTSNDIEIGDLDKLENELNDLTTNEPHRSSGGGLYEKTLSMGETIQLPTIDEPTFTNDSKLGSATVETIGSNSNGFMKPPSESFMREAKPRMTDREMRRKKRIMLKKLEQWHEKGLVSGKLQLNMESEFDEVEDEYETALEDKRKKDSVKLQGWWFMTAVNSIEYANTAFNPFDLNLDGWGEQINEDIDSYEEIFSELHDKYKGGKMAPELSLALRLGFSAAVVNFTNKALSTAAPGFNDVMKQNPDLMKAFSDATVNTMSQQSPGFGFMNNMMNEQEMRPRGPPPPASQETKSTRAQPTKVVSSRPDIRASLNEPGVELGGFQNVNSQDNSSRPEMKGPANSDIDNILAGLKTKNVNIQNETKEDSVISANSLGQYSAGSKTPKRTQKRKQKSDKNVISLDI